MVEYYLIIALFAGASMWVQYKLKSTFKKYSKVQLIKKKEVQWSSCKAGRKGRKLFEKFLLNKMF